MIVAALAELLEALCRETCRANIAVVRQPRPDSGLGLQVKALKTVSVVPSSDLSFLFSQPFCCESCARVSVNPADLEVG